MHRFNINIYIYMWVMTECFNTRILRINSVYSALEVLHAHTRNNKKLFRMHLLSKPFEFIAFGLMLTNDMITLTKCRNRRVWYGLGQTNWIQMEMCIDFYLHSNHRQLVEPIYASFVPFLLFSSFTSSSFCSVMRREAIKTVLFWWEKNPMILFSLHSFICVQFNCNPINIS